MKHKGGLVQHAPCECFPKLFCPTGSTALCCLLLCHSYYRFYPKPCKQRKHRPCLMDSTNLEKSRYLSAQDGKEKWDSRCPEAKWCFGRMAAQQPQSPHAVRTDRCTSCKASACGELHGWKQEKIIYHLTAIVKTWIRRFFNVGWHNLVQIQLNSTEQPKEW